MPASISPLAQALRMLKVELNQARGAVANRPTSATNPNTAGAAAKQASALQALRTQVRAARGADGKLPPGKALRLFVQAALLDELGTELQLDPAMSDLVERTCQAIEQDPGSAPLLAEAMQELEALAG